MSSFGTPTGTPTGSPVKTTTYTHAPSAPSKRYNRDIEAMNELITELYDGIYNEQPEGESNEQSEGKSNVHPVSTFQGKLLKNQTELLERENQNPVTRVYIDNATQNDRLVYKISYNSIIQREIEAYEALEKHDVNREHILTRVNGHIMLNEKFGMFITQWREGLEPENLIWPNITRAENNRDKTEADRLHGLEKEATKYLIKAGVEHKDIAGNLYEVDGTFVWIDFEQSETKKSWFSSISPFSSPEKRPGLFGDSDDENESPNKKGNYEKGKTNSLFDSDDEMGGGKSRNKKSRKNKKHKRKSKSNKRKSNKRKTKSHKRK